MKWETKLVLDEKGLGDLIREHIMGNPEKYQIDLKTDVITQITFSTKTDPNDTGYGNSRDIFGKVTITIERDTERGKVVESRNMRNLYA